ncbi:MAG: metal-dependent hydrolase [Fibrobacteres bacterium]|jgi:inner membrane protein|nr:metal-dependent hydrolase [Fibrobacterota bacterium]
MASAFSHALAAVALGSIFRWDKPPLKFWSCGIACAVLPDLDSLDFALGVPYGSMFGHRGFTHSLCFALLLGILTTLLFFRDELRQGRGIRVCLYLFLSTASHGVLDALTNGGLGVAFFSPFNTTRYFFPFHPVQVSPINALRFLRGGGWAVMASEWKWLMLPLLALILGAEGSRRALKRTLAGSPEAG